MGNSIVPCLSSDAINEVQDNHNLSRVPNAVDITLRNSRLEKEMNKSMSEIPYLFDISQHSPIGTVDGTSVITTTNTTATDSEHFLEEEKPTCAKLIVTVSSTSACKDDCYEKDTEESSQQEDRRGYGGTTAALNNLSATENIFTENSSEPSENVHENDAISIDIFAKRSLSLMSISPIASLKSLTTDSVKQILLSACMNSFSPKQFNDSSETSSINDTPLTSVPRSFSEMGSVSDGYSKSVLRQSMKNPNILIGW